MDILAAEGGEKTKPNKANLPALAGNSKH